MSQPMLGSFLQPHQIVSLSVVYGTRLFDHEDTKMVESKVDACCYYLRSTSQRSHGKRQ